MEELRFTVFTFTRFIHFTCVTGILQCGIPCRNFQPSTLYIEMRKWEKVLSSTERH